jgi:hypothetical protein
MCAGLRLGSRGPRNRLAPYEIVITGAAKQSELEVRSLNEFTGYGFPKDYDAVVQAEHDGRSYHLSLEYERSAKTPDRYAQVRQAVEKESQLDCVLYLMPAYPLLTYVAGFFERCTRPVYFALCDDFENAGHDGHGQPTPSIGSTARGFRQ